MEVREKCMYDGLNVEEEKEKVTRDVCPRLFIEDANIHV